MFISQRLYINSKSASLITTYPKKYLVTKSIFPAFIPLNKIYNYRSFSNSSLKFKHILPGHLKANIISNYNQDSREGVKYESPKLLPKIRSKNVMVR